jgi:putative peptidoglycan lipid II flippase
VNDEGTSRSLARSSSIVGGAVLVSRLLGLVREQVFAALFGAGRELDAFVAAFRIPNLFRDLFAEGALSAAFVTTFAQKVQREGEAAAWRLANLVLHALVLVVGSLVLLGMWASPWIVDVMAPGFSEIAGKAELTVRLTRLMFPFLLFVALAAVAMGMLNARGRFGVPASASSFFNLGSILGGIGAAWWLAPDFIAHALGRSAAPLDPAAAERAILGMALGTLAGGLMQLAVQLPSLHRLNYRYAPILSFRDPGVRQVLALMGPATIGAAAVQVNVLVNTNFASTLGDGPVSWLNVAFRFMQLPIGLFGVAVGVVALPAVSRQAASADLDAFNRTTTRALRLVFGLCLPAAAGLALLAPELIGLVYEHGRFTARDTQMAASALAAYSLGLVGYANIKVLVPAFYALGDARTPALVSCLSILVNAVGNWVAIRWLGLGHTGLALITALVATANFGVLFVVLTGRVGRFEGLGRATMRMAVATLGVVAVCVATKALVATAIAPGMMARATVVAVAVPTAALVFGALGARLGLEETQWMVRRLGAVLRRR